MRRYAIIAAILLLACIDIHNAFASNVRLSESEITRIINASTKHSYSATGVTTILWHGKWYKSAIRQYNQIPNKSRIEYKSFPLEGVVVCCDGRLTWRKDPQVDKQVYIESAGCMSVDQKRKLFIRNYSAYVSGSAKQAGRNARIIDIKDKSERLKKRIWVDAATYVTLRSEEYNASTRMISSTSFTSIDYNSRIPNSIFKRPSGNVKSGCENLFVNIKSIAELSRKVGFVVMLPKYMPTGFNVDGYRLYNCSCKCGYKSAYIRYSNGMVGISIFESIADIDCSKMCGEDMHMPAEKANASVNGVNIYIFSNLKSTEIRKIADSFR